MKNFLLVAALSACAWAQQASTCATPFTVVLKDKLGNEIQGLSADDQKWFQDKLAKKYPDLCYVAPAELPQTEFYITVTTDVYEGTQTRTSTDTVPVHATVTDQNGNTTTVTGTQRVTSKSEVPYSTRYPVYTLSVGVRQPSGTFVLMHNFQRRGLCSAFSIMLGKCHASRDVIEDALKWVHSGELAAALEAQQRQRSSRRNGSNPVFDNPYNHQASSNPATSIAASPANQQVSSETAGITISSSPDGADIYVDGEFRGNTPSTLKLPAGKHVFRVILSGYQDWSRAMDMSVGSDVKLSATLTK